MKSEKEKMLGGELYSPLDPQLFAERQRVRLLFKAFNDTSDDQRAERIHLLQQIILMAGKGLLSNRPFTVTMAVISLLVIMFTLTSTV